MTIQIKLLETPHEMQLVEKLHKIVWGADDLDVIPAHVSLALSQNGGVVLGAFDGEVLVGHLLGFLGTDHRSPDRPAAAGLKHASHELAVDPAYRSQGIGLKLKLAQRQAVRKQGVRLITWTYDPLLSLNAHLNIRRLGAVCDTYHDNAYGEMQDDLNRGTASDRFQVDWWITSNRVEQRISGPREALDLAHFLGAGADRVNQVQLNDRGLPVPDPQLVAPQGKLALVEIPSDFMALKAQDRDLAIQWRAHTRQIFRSAFASGYLVTDFIHLKEERLPRSYYVLTYGEGTFG
jgi:predicted GNAT superfamily acetyltransferase